MRTLATSVQSPESLPAIPIDEKALIDSLEAAMKTNAEIETRKSNRARMASDAQLKEKEVLALAEEITRLEEKMARIQGEANALREKLEKAPTLPGPSDISKIRVQIDEAKAINAAIVAPAENKEKP